MMTSNISVSDESILPVDGIIFGDLQDSLAIEEIAERCNCDMKMPNPVLKEQCRPASDPSVGGESRPQWPALWTMISQNAVSPLSSAFSRGMLGCRWPDQGDRLRRPTRN